MYWDNAYKGVICLLAVTGAIGIVLVVGSMALATQNPDQEKQSGYECGFEPFSDTRDQFEVRYFLVGILFIVFDIEVALLLPLGIVKMGYTKGVILVVLLGIGLVYEWERGALEWE